MQTHSGVGGACANGASKGTGKGGGAPVYDVDARQVALRCHAVHLVHQLGAFGKVHGVDRRVAGHHLPQLGSELDAVVDEVQRVDEGVQVAQLPCLVAHALKGLRDVVAQPVYSGLQCVDGRLHALQRPL